MKTRVALLMALLIFVIPAFLPYAEEAKVNLFPQSNKGLKLNEVLTSFKESNPNIKILEGRLEADRAKHRQSKLWPNPEVGYRVEDSADTDTLIEASWPIDITGRRWMERKAANAGIASAESLYQWEINSLLSDVKVHFYELLAGQEHLRIAEEGARRYESILNNVRGRSGQTDYDRLRLEKEVSEVKADAGEVKREVIKLQTDLAILLNEDPNNLRLTGETKSVEVIPQREVLESAILSNHPKVVATLKELESKNYKRKAARRKWFPELNLSGGFKNTSGDEVDESGFIGGVSISLPVFDRGQAERQAANAELKVAESEAALTKNEITQLFIKAYQDATLLKTAVQDYETALLNAERLEQMAGLAYLEGRLGILELLDAYRGAIQSRLRYLNLALEGKLSEIELERIMGHSLDSLTEEKK
jgi:cobalt-zinc-cadmium efflux system outer membrane protein